MRAKSRPGSRMSRIVCRSLPTIPFPIRHRLAFLILAFALIAASAPEAGRAQSGRFGGPRPEAGVDVPPAQPAGPATPVQQKGGPAPVVAFLDFESNTVSVDEEVAFSQALWTEFYRRSGTRVLPRTETRQFLIRKNLYPGLPAPSPHVSLGQVAEALNAEYVIIGHINTTGGTFSYDYEVYSAELGQSVGRDSVVAPGEMRDLMLQAPDLARTLAFAVQRGERLSAPGARPGQATDLAVSPSGGPPAAAAEPATPERTRTAEAERRRERTRELQQMEAAQQQTARPAERRIAQAPAENEGPKVVSDSGPTKAPAASKQEVKPAANPKPRPEPVEEIPAEDEVTVELAAEPERADIEPELTPEPTPEPTPRPTPRPTPEVTPTPEPTATPTPRPTPTPTPEATATPEPTPRPTATPEPQPTPEPEPEPATTAEPAKAMPAEERVVSETARESAQALFMQSQSLPSDDYAQKIDLLRRAVTLDPTDGSYRKALALAYYNVGDYESCIEQCKEAVELLPEDSILYTILGSAYFESRQYERAREAHEEAIAANPQNLYSRFNLALTLQAQGKPQALQAWEEYLRLSEGDAEQAANRVRALEYYEDLKAQNS